MDFLMNEISTNQVNFYYVTENEDNQRLDNLLIKVLKGVPKSHIYRIIRSGEVRLNKSRAEVSSKVKIGDVVRIPPIRVASVEEKTNIPKTTFPVLFEDDYYLIIDKPAGTACHGGSGVSFGVIEQLRQNLNYKFLELAHRLDRGTSGVLILAKKRTALVKLQELMKNNLMLKEYYALSVGVIPDNKRNVKLPIYKYTTKTGERKVRVDHENGQFAHTIFTVKERFDGFTLVSASLQTGKTHQIRLHLQSIGFPIAGDEKYGDFSANDLFSKRGLKRMFLHAYHIKFTHPIEEKIIEINSPLPDTLQSFINKLKE